MARKKPVRGVSRKQNTVTPKPGRPNKPPRNLLLLLDDLMDNLRWSEALSLVTQLQKEHPDDNDLLMRQAVVYGGLGDHQNEAELAEILYQRTPGNPDLLVALLSARNRANQPALAMQTARLFLSLFPTHREASGVRKFMESLEADLTWRLTHLGLPSGPESLASAMAYERMMIAVNNRETENVIALATELLTRHPNMAQVRNLLALQYARLCRPDLGMIQLEHVIAVDPGNICARANKVRLFCSAGYIEGARTEAARLLLISPVYIEDLRKQAEALTCLGDHEAMVRLYEARLLENAKDDAFLCHLAAVAHARLGHEAEAQKLWQRARNSPWMLTVEENLADLAKPPHDRNGPHAYELSFWFEASVILELQALTSTLGPTEGSRALIKRYPTLLSLMAVVLDRGDLASRLFATTICVTAGTSECLTLLRGFVTSDRGKVVERQNVASLVETLEQRAREEAAQVALSAPPAGA